MIRARFRPLAASITAALLFAGGCQGPADETTAPAQPRRRPATELAKMARALPHSAPFDVSGLAFYDDRLFATTNVGLLEVRDRRVDAVYTWFRSDNVVSGPWTDDPRGALWINRLRDGVLLRLDKDGWSQVDVPRPPQGSQSRGDVLFGFSRAPDPQHFSAGRRGPRLHLDGRRDVAPRGSAAGGGIQSHGRVRVRGRAPGPHRSQRVHAPAVPLHGVLGRRRPMGRSPAAVDHGLPRNGGGARRRVRRGRRWRSPAGHARRGAGDTDSRAGRCHRDHDRRRDHRKLQRRGDLSAGRDVDQAARSAVRAVATPAARLPHRADGAVALATVEREPHRVALWVSDGPRFARVDLPR